LIQLQPITESNWQEAARLSVSKEQATFLDTPTGILARGYVYRDSGARVFAITNDNTVIGLALVRSLDEAPACYDLQQFMIDLRYQKLGHGAQALGLIVGMLRNEAAYDCIEVCVHKQNAAALRLFENAGFADTGYIDDAVPDCLNLMYYFQ
jgi:RimJ/RimL family protein N-acetyltransferase